MTEAQLLGCKKIGVFHSAGYVKGVSCNTPTRVHRCRVVLTRDNGERLEIGTGRASTKTAARAKAIAAAIEWATA